MRSFTELPPLSLYVHIPWCVRKCPYCDFNSHEQKTDALPELEYVDALLQDLTEEIPRFWGRTLSSVFIGGGTPSLFSSEALDRLLSGVRALTALPPNAEITMEANPGTFEQAKFSEFRSLGINRLSIGVQSFDDDALHKLGRIHGGGEALSAIDMAKKAGFDDFNIDLMFGLPGQNLKQAAKDVALACNASPTHISYYELTLEPNTLFAKYPPTLPTDDTVGDIQSAGIAQLASAGFDRYEISAYAKSGKRSTHNTNYWLFGDYIGIGAGAHGKLSFADSGQIIRRWKHKHPTQYMASMASNDFCGDEKIVSVDDTGIEFMMNALRLVDGFPIDLFTQHTGVLLAPWQAAIDKACDAALLTQAGYELKPTETGLRFLNDLLAMFMTSETTRSYPVIPLKLD